MNLIPVFELKEVEISKDAGEGLIIYAQQLSLINKDYPQCIEGEGKEADGRVFLRVESLDETFITTDLMESKSWSTFILYLCLTTVIFYSVLFVFPWLCAL